MLKHVETNEPLVMSYAVFNNAEDFENWQIDNQGYHVNSVQIIMPDFGINFEEKNKTELSGIMKKGELSVFVIYLKPAELPL